MLRRVWLLFGRRKAAEPDRPSLPPAPSSLPQAAPTLPPAAASAPAPDRSHWTSADWARVRAPERHRDRELSPKAQRWLARLPDEMRPLELCLRHPRIVNRLAQLWRDEGLTEVCLIELMTDTRGGRQGFAPVVMAELEALYEWHTARVDARETATDRWSASTRP